MKINMLTEFGIIIIGILFLIIVIPLFLGVCISLFLGFTGVTYYLFILGIITFICLFFYILWIQW